MIPGRSPGERIITTTSSSATAPPGAPVPDALLGSGKGGRMRGQAPSPIQAQSAKAAASSFFPLGGVPSVSSLPSSPAASVSKSAPMSPAGGSAQEAFGRGDAGRTDPLGGSMHSLQAPTALRQPPQRMRSVPHESTSTARLSSGSHDSDRPRGAVFSLSARSVHVTSGGSSRFPSTGSHADPPGGQRSARPSVDGPTAGGRGSNGAEQPDSLHDAVARFCVQRPTGRYPLVRLSRGVYLYGNKKLVVAVHNDKLMVRIGGGFVHLESYLMDCDRLAQPASPGAISPVAGGHFDPAPRPGVNNSRGAVASRR